MSIISVSNVKLLLLQHMSLTAVQRLPSQTVRFLKTRTSYQFDHRIKLLNDQQQYEKAIRLLDELKEDNLRHQSSTAITQFLKACAHTRDITRGSKIHAMVAHRLKDDSFIVASLIHLYSKCYFMISFTILPTLQSSAMQ